MGYMDEQRAMVADAFDYAKEMALNALDTCWCTDMYFRLDFGENHAPTIESNIKEYFVSENN